MLSHGERKKRKERKKENDCDGATSVNGVASFGVGPSLNLIPKTSITRISGASKKIVASFCRPKTP